METVLERKSERIAARITPTQKSVLLKAAQLSGMDLSEFVLAKAQSAAEDTIRDYAGVIGFALEDQARIFDALTDTTIKPNAKLQSALKDHDNSVLSL